MCIKNKLKKRRNTLQEKRKMRAERKKRKRHMKAAMQQESKSASKLKTDLDTKQNQLEASQNKMQMYKNMARTYWERWRWECEKRKELGKESLIPLNVCCQYSSQGSSTTDKLMPPQINPAMLIDLSEDLTTYVDRGSFGIVKLQLYRGIYVAVKQVLPRTFISDVIAEAKCLMKLSHPNLPHFFGICTEEKPYCIVMQFEGVQSNDGSHPQALNLHQELHKDGILHGMDWVSVCAQLSEAVRYLHFDMEILHNDIKPDNILLSNMHKKYDHPKPKAPFSISVVLTDFGKASSVSNGKRYNLSLIEQADYNSRPELSFYLAPEIISGETKQSRQSDMFAVGGIIYRIIDKNKLSSLPNLSKKLNYYAEKCRFVQYNCRPNAKQAVEFFEELLK